MNKKTDFVCPNKELRTLIRNITIIPQILGLIIIINTLTHGWVVPNPILLTEEGSKYPIKFEFGFIVLFFLIGLVKWKILVIVAFLAPLVDFLAHGHDPESLYVEIGPNIVWMAFVVFAWKILIGKKGGRNNFSWITFVVVTVIAGCLIGVFQIILFFTIFVKGGITVPFFFEATIWILWTNSIKLLIIAGIGTYIKKKISKIDKLILINE